MSNWTEVRLGDVLTLQRGFDITKNAQRPGPVPVVSSSGIASFHDEARADGPGVVIGRKGSLGTAFFVNGPYWPHDTTLWVKDFKGNDPYFCYLLLKNLRLSELDAGSSNPTLNRNHAHLLRVRIVDVVTQRRVAAILSAFDELIEINGRRIELLEDLARSVYREWFVRFRFPGHENVEFVDSDLGSIPAGWEVWRLLDLVTTQYGYTASASDKEVGPKLLRGMDINKRSFVDWATVPYCEIDDEQLSKFRLEVDDICVIRMADPGKGGIVEADVDAVFASYLVRIRSADPRLPPYLLFHFLDSAEYQDWVTGSSTGSTRKSASAAVLTEPRLAIPTPELARLYDSKARALRQQLTALVATNAALARTRDLLLPPLVTGRLDISHIDLGDLLPSEGP